MSPWPVFLDPLDIELLNAPVISLLACYGRRSDREKITRRRIIWVRALLIDQQGVRTLVFLRPRRQNRTMAFAAHQRVRVSLAGLMIQGVTFHAAVTDALATIVRKTTEEPPAYLVDLLFSFKGLKEIEVPEERIRPA